MSRQLVSVLVGPMLHSPSPSRPRRWSLKRSVRRWLERYIQERFASNAEQRRTFLATANTRRLARAGGRCRTPRRRMRRWAKNLTITKAQGCVLVVFLSSTGGPLTILLTHGYCGGHPQTGP